MDTPAFTPDELFEFTREMRYHHCRVLPDGSTACLIPLMYTTGIIMGVTRDGFAVRYCFEDTTLALNEYMKLQSEDDKPEGNVATRDFRERTQWAR